MAVDVSAVFFYPKAGLRLKSSVNLSLLRAFWVGKGLRIHDSAAGAWRAEESQINLACLNNYQYPDPIFLVQPSHGYLSIP